MKTMVGKWKKFVICLRDRLSFVVKSALNMHFPKLHAETFMRCKLPAYMRIPYCELVQIFSFIDGHIYTIRAFTRMNEELPGRQEKSMSNG